MRRRRSRISTRSACSVSVRRNEGRGAERQHEYDRTHHGRHKWHWSRRSQEILPASNHVDNSTIHPQTFTTSASPAPTIRATDLAERTGGGAGGREDRPPPRIARKAFCFSRCRFCFSELLSATVTIPVTFGYVTTVTVIGQWLRLVTAPVTGHKYFTAGIFGWDGEKWQPAPRTAPVPCPSPYQSR